MRPSAVRRSAGRKPSFVNRDPFFSRYFNTYAPSGCKKTIFTYYIGAVHVHPYGAITRGERGEALADMEAMAPFVAGFSDDGRGVQSGEMMQEAMGEAKRLGKPVAGLWPPGSAPRSPWRRCGRRGI